MFELKESITNWKQKLNSSNSLTSNDIEELESHLLDEIDLLKEKDLSEEEAFFVATSRLGSVDLLSSEYIKVNSRTMFFKKIVLLLGGYVVISFIQNLISIISMIICQTLVIANMDPAKGNVMNSDYNSKLSFWLSLILTAIVLIIFINGRLQLLTKIQSGIEKLSTFKKSLIVILFLVLGFMNSMGFYMVVNLFIHGGYDVLGIARGQSDFTVLWPIIICLSFILISFKENRKQQTA